MHKNKNSILLKNIRVIDTSQNLDQEMNITINNGIISYFENSKKNIQLIRHSPPVLVLVVLGLPVLDVVRLGIPAQKRPLRRHLVYPPSRCGRALVEAAERGAQERVTGVDEDDLLRAALSAWADQTKELLQWLELQGDSVGKSRTPKQVMALGSVRTHMVMSLKALRYSES